ncbi:hypothetical protein [Candidatus Chlamydia sanziniae]|uniref:Uncharacterized protein n=1 Tax=Candidatus Chlamydia sanziniae TaxID=1806891 RepID=A0A1A9HUT0_9CHLA|nr:hypothetical protein [Candidatus Chlamydia sanziniae]ANH78749.1 hypothetical protein Cs308_0579 [Candidatus Chlamydia sanziniae]
MLHKVTLPETSKIDGLQASIEQVAMSSIFIFTALKKTLDTNYVPGMCQAENALSVEANKIISVVQNSLAAYFCK